jgi:transglutaminase-like putative cysteine protease
MRASLSCAGILAMTLAVGAADAPLPVLRDTREVVLLDGTKIGSLRTVVRDDAGTGKLRTSSELELNFRCYGAAVHVRREYSDVETSDGQVLSLSVKQLQGQGRQLALTGTVEGDRMHVVVDGGRIERRLRWSEEVVGLAAQDRLLADRRPKPGDRFTFLRYEPIFNTVVTVRVTVKTPEAVGEKGQKLLRVELQPDPIEAPGSRAQPPASVAWLDEAFRTVRRETELDGVGKVLILPAAQDEAPGTAEKSVDVGLRNLVPLDRRIARPHATRSAVFRITLKGEPANAFVRDGHQEVRNVRGNSFDLVVHPVHPLPGASAGPAADEYSAPNYFVDSDDPTVKDLARRAVDGATDSWTKAVRIERWVFQSMTPAGGAALVPASRVARELRGDCRAYALLTTALCRSEGIPARTALGLVYIERSAAGPSLGFHMWTEVCLGGRWIGLDGTLGQGGIGACHVKISDHSWQATRSLTPLLPVDRVLGRISAEIVSVDGGP